MLVMDEDEQHQMKECLANAVRHLKGLGDTNESIRRQILEAAAIGLLKSCPDLHEQESWYDDTRLLLDQVIDSHR